MGLWFGANSHVTLKAQYTCSKGCCSNTWWHKWWGWTCAGDPVTISVTCHGKKLTLWSNPAYLIVYFSKFLLHFLNNIFIILVNDIIIE